MFKALVADRDPNSLAYAYDALETIGWYVVGCISAQDVLAETSRLKPELVLLELELGETRGMDMVKIIKAASPRTCVVLMGRKADWDLYMEALDRGAADLLTKPLQRADIIRSVDGWNGQKPLNGEQKRSTQVQKRSNYPGGRSLDP